MNSIQIRLSSPDEIDRVAVLYDRVNDYFAETASGYSPSWGKGIYPTIHTARQGCAQNGLFVLEREGEFAASCILNSDQPEGYDRVPWSVAAQGAGVVVLHTLVVNPACRKLGLGRRMVEFALAYGRKAGAKTLRLDTHACNLPARRLYTDCGLQDMGCWELDVDGSPRSFAVFEFVF